MYAGNGGPTRQDSYFLSPYMPKTAEMALPVPTKTFLSRSPDTAMLFAPFGCTHPPPPAPPSLLAQSLSPKDIAGCDIMKLKVSWRQKAPLAGKVLMGMQIKLKRSYLMIFMRILAAIWVRPCQVSAYNQS